MLLWPANFAISWMSQSALAKSVKRRWRQVCVVNRSTPAREEMRFTALDHVQIETGAARLRRDSDRNRDPRLELMHAGF